MATYNCANAAYSLTNITFYYPIIFDDVLSGTGQSGTQNATFTDLSNSDLTSKFIELFGFVAIPNPFPIQTGTATPWLTAVTAYLLENDILCSSSATSYVGISTRQFYASASNIANGRTAPAIYATQQGTAYIQYYIPILTSVANQNGVLRVDATTAPRPTVLTVNLQYNTSTEKWILTITGVDYLSTYTSYAFNWSPLDFPIVIDTDDPYISAGYPEATAPGGMSQGSFDFTEDGLTAVHTPSMDVLGAGLVTCWNPSKAQLAAVASWLWSTQPAQILQDLLGNPINAIIGLNILPVQPDVDGGTNTIHFGPEDTAVAAPKCTSQYVTVDCGSLKIEPKYGSYMDYAPPASAELFLPYCGGVPLDINDVIDKTITIKYQVDILSGACVAYVFIDGTLHYQRPGACAATVPITGVQMPNVVSGALSIVGAVAGAIASLGASGAGTAAKVASGIATGTSIASTAANMLKQQISYSGTVSGWAGLLGAQTPYVILALPHATIPGGQNVIMGYPAWVSGRIGDFSGYTECKIDHVYALGATDAEVDEIKTLLEGGVIL